MFDDAEKKISRLMAESTTSGESKASIGTIKLNGQGNFFSMGDINLTFHINSATMGMAEPRTDQVLPHDLLTYADFERSKAAILQKCKDLNDADLYLPFIKAAYGAEKLDDLKPAELGRLEWWLGIRAERP